MRVTRRMADANLIGHGAAMIAGPVFADRC